jgi:hypothetical protein
MLSWRRLAISAVLLSTLAGCRSAHIKDAYVSRDDDGVRRTECIRPSWRHYYVIVELMSFKEDTLLWPFLRCIDGECLGNVIGPNGVIAPPFGEGDEDLVEFGNIAPGKSEGNHSLEFKEYEMIEGQRQQKDLTSGLFQWDLYLDDEEEPRESLGMTVDPACPCKGSVVDCP